VTRIDWIVSGDEEGNMDQMIVAVLAIGAFYWGLRVVSWKSVKVRVRVAQGFSLRRLRTRL
jgi:hypothetical protein